jgi:WD40 repeat protein
MSGKGRALINSRLRARARQISVVRTIRVDPEYSGPLGSNYVTWTAFSPDGRWLATASMTGSVKVWDWSTGAEVAVLGDSGQRAYHVAFSRDGEFLCAGGNDTARVWRWRTGELWLEYASEVGNAWVDFSTDGPLLAITESHFGGATMVHLHDLRTKARLHSWPIDRHSMHVIFSPGDETVATVNLDTVRFHDPRTGEDVKEPWPFNDFNWMAYGPDGKAVALVSCEGLRVRDARNGRVLWGRDIGATTEVNGVAWSPDGRFIATRSSTRIGLKLWYARTGALVYKRAQNEDMEWRTMVVSFSPDSRLLVGCTPDHSGTIEILDISALKDVEDEPEPAAARRGPVEARATDPLVLRHLSTLALSHTTGQVPARPAYWLRGAATIGGCAPLWIARDIGHVLTQSDPAIARPSHLPEDIDTTPYLQFLTRLAAAPMVRELSRWDMSDTMIGVLLARLLEGVTFPASYASPGTAVEFARQLAAVLDQADPVRLWRDAAPADRPAWHELMPAAHMTRVESNLARLGVDELRFLHRYGPRFSGAPDPRDLLDLFNLLNLPAPARQSLLQVMRLLPRISESMHSSSAQTQPAGGYEGLMRKGDLDSLVPTELAYPRDVFFYRLHNQEALYYGHDNGETTRRELVYIVTQLGVEIAGDADLLARTLTLALAQTMLRRGYDVQQSFVGREWTLPEAMNRPRDVQRLLYYRDEGMADVPAMLEAVSRQLHAWQDRYRRIQVLWVVASHWDADDRGQHAAMYRRLRQQGVQHAWFVRIAARGARSAPEPAALRDFQNAHVIDNQILWPS